LLPSKQRTDRADGWDGPWTVGSLLVKQQPDRDAPNVLLGKQRSAPRPQASVRKDDSGSARYPSRALHGGTMADTAQAGDVVPATSREELLAQHAEARHRRNAAPLGSPEWEEASHEVGRIEIAIAAMERSMDPPRV
jgi:hypothetical protein